MTLKLDLPSELEERLLSEAARCGVVDSEYALDAIAERLQGEESSDLSEIGKSLLREIDRGFSEEWWGQYRKLVAKREDGSITGEEHRELSVLTNSLEEYNVRRMSCIANAAKHQGIELMEFMKRFGFEPRQRD